MIILVEEQQREAQKHITCLANHAFYIQFQTTCVASLAFVGNVPRCLDSSLAHNYTVQASNSTHDRLDQAMALLN